MYYLFMPMIGNIGTTEIFLIAIVLFFVFGGKKLREWSKGISEAGKEVRSVKKEIDRGLTDPLEDEIVEKEEKHVKKSESKDKKEVEN